MAVATRRRGRAGPRRATPWPCKDCRARIIWATIRKLDGRMIKRPVNAEPIRHGGYEYAAGSALRPVLRELDRHELLDVPQGDRYGLHACQVSADPRMAGTSQ